MALALHMSFDDAIKCTESALKTQGFGVLTRINVQEILKTKINVDFRPYTILGACNPTLAHDALHIEDKVGTMLPCNLVVQQKDDGIVEIAAVDPVASMQAIDNPELKKAASMVRDKLSRVIETLSNSTAPS